MINESRHEVRRIVVGVDSSRGSRTALRWALTQADLTGAAVEAVAVWQDPVAYGPSYGWIPTLNDADRIPALAEKALSETVSEALQAVGRPVDVLLTVRQGAAAQVLLASAVGADLLVVGSRGHGAFAGMLLGSVSQHCAQHAPCAVVVVPDEETAETSQEP
jgi:nucleotide-binding universal stress UspA family protein